MKALMLIPILLIECNQATENATDKPGLFDDSVTTTRKFELVVDAFTAHRYSDARYHYKTINLNHLSKDQSYQLSKIIHVLDSIEKSNPTPQYESEPQRSTKNSSLDIDQLRRELVGREWVYPWSIEIINKYGQPETLSGTNGLTWYAYFPRGEFTITLDKGTDRITAVRLGRGD